MKKSFVKRLEKSESIADLFEIIKETVSEAIGRERGGLMLGFVDMGVEVDHFIGAFYPVGSNMIVVNKTPIKIIEETRPDLLKHYLFHVILHEYLHSVGILDERTTRMCAYMISRKYFGEYHQATTIARDFNKIFPSILMGVMGQMFERNSVIEIVDDFEKDISYIG